MSALRFATREPAVARICRPLGALLAAALLLAPALSQAKAKGSIMAFVGSEDRPSEAASVKFHGLVEQALGRYGRYDLTALRDAAGQPVPNEARGVRKLALKDLAAGRSALGEGQLDAAEQSLRAAIKGLESVPAAQIHVDDYAEAYADLAATLQLRSKEDDAKDALAQTLAVEPTYKPDAKLAASAFADLLRVVKKESAGGHRGSASISTTPSGARVYVDGEFKGFSPLSIDHLPGGKHLFRFERPGFFDAGQVGDITSTDDLSVKGHFNPTTDFSAYQDSVAVAIKETDSSKAGPATFKIMDHYQVDRAVFCDVKTSGETLVLDLRLVDARSHKRIARRKNSFEGSDEAMLAREVNHLVSGLLADADNAGKPVDPKASQKDPLDSVSGMEDWGDDDSAPAEEVHRGHHKSSSEDEAPRKRRSHDDE